MKPDIQPTDIHSARMEMSRRLFLTLLTFFSCAALLLFVLAIFLGDAKITALAGINVILALLAFFLQKRDKLELAGAFVSFGLLFTGFYATWTSGYGIEDSSVVVLPVSSLLAALLLGKRAMWAQIIVAIIGVTVIGLRVQLCIDEDGAPRHAPPIDIVLVSTVLLVVTLGLRRLNSDLWSTLRVAVTNEQKLLDSHQALIEL